MPMVRPAEAVGLLETDGPTPMPVLVERELMPRADVLLVFPNKPTPLVRGIERGALAAEVPGLRPPTDSERHRMESWLVKRQCTIAALSDAGLILMPFYSRGRDQVFVKVAADEARLRSAAEGSRYRLELKPEYMSAFAEYQSDFAGRREWNYCDRRLLSHLYRVHGADRRSPSNDNDGLDEGDEEEAEKQMLRPPPPRPPSFFRTVDRVRLIDHIIRSVDPDNAGVDVGQLMHDGDLWSYFPLHENGKLVDLDQDWFKCFAWGSHVDKVRDYFGERIAMYFSFMAHIHQWLLPAALVGLLFWCLDAVAFGGSSDNGGALLLCIGACFWTSTFVHFWRRAAAEKALRWGTAELPRQFEPSRPEFWGVQQVNPVTERVDRYYPWSQRIWKVAFSYIVISVSLLLLCMVLSIVMALRHLFARIGGRRWLQVAIAVVVEIMNNVFGSLARRLTDMENHRSQSQYSRHLLAKTFLFKFVNCYAPLYYIAFFKDHSSLFGMPMACVSGDCLSDLGSQLAVFLFMRLALQSFVELLLPYLQSWCRSVSDGYVFPTSFARLSQVAPDLPKAEREHFREEHDLCEAMDWALMSYGYATLFFVACPWAPFLVWLSSMLQCFVDQKKLVLSSRRPFPLAAADNEPWDTAFEVLSVVACITNAGITAFSSATFDSWADHHRVMMFIVLEHMAMAVRIVTTHMFPAVPVSVQMTRHQHRALLRRYFDLGGEENEGDSGLLSLTPLGSNLTPAPPVFDEEPPGADEEMW